jgi:molybdenum cofactor guanylyltransferase
VATAPDRASITGVVLAGGRGSRMGGADKGWVQYEGRALVEHALARLQPQVGALLISANRNIARYRALGPAVVEDDTAQLDAFSGPLAGMLAGLRSAGLPWVAFVPCDAPALPLDLVATLARASGGLRPAVASCGDRRQPVFCLVPASAADPLAAALAAGERRPAEFLRLIGAVEVAFADAQAFVNINTRAAAAGEPSLPGMRDA